MKAKDKIRISDIQSWRIQRTMLKINFKVVIRSTFYICRHH